jgi:hypothetical protein
MKRQFRHLAGVAATIAVLSVTVTGHGAWSQTARTIKVVVAVQPGAARTTSLACWERRSAVREG